MTTNVEDTAASRPLFDQTQVLPGALKKMSAFHAECITEVARTVKTAPIAVIGMAQNPHVKNVRKALKDAGIEYSYLEYGSYFSGWKERLAIKLWSGWPTFPQVFVKGALLGGEDLTVEAIADGTLKRLLAEKAS